MPASVSRCAALAFAGTLVSRAADRDHAPPDYGLDPPVTQIVLEVEGEGAQHLAIGKHNPVNTSLYAQVNQSSQMVLIGSIVSWELRKLMDAVQSAASAG